ncbi:BON domain-containing protein [Paraburkholderia acidisoli]|uniref:BON domain-containing protein n=1 Tax=Paraburkholderia acidisoli TaxID=2571748 RepID=A0A7Z2GRM6_9BURK|nr:BON domain-containing protein [Paraburkholderia acidisoli]QGZ66703.1 BON domain-containing protein [Paraburkholderia acidisoli]
MKKNLLRAACVVSLSAFALGAYAQTASDATSTNDMSMSQSAPAASGKATKADRALGRAVRKALAKTNGFDVSGVFVRARGGAVTLSGSVRSGDQIQKAEDVAKSVQGVTSVSNKLTLFHGGNG